jgi:hypothetical protein
MSHMSERCTLLEAAEIPEGKSALFTMDAAHAQNETAEVIGGNPGSAMS